MKTIVEKIDHYLKAKEGLQKAAGQYGFTWDKKKLDRSAKDIARLIKQGKIKE